MKLENLKTEFLGRNIFFYKNTKIIKIFQIILELDKI